MVTFFFFFFLRSTPQVRRGPAERGAGSARRGQLGDGPNAEKVLEDQAGVHQSHRQKGGRVRGGV